MDESLFWSKVSGKDGDGCWLWTGSLNPDGYGQCWPSKRKPERAHRASWVLAFGPIPYGLMVCHKCDVRNCVRPSHLFLGTALDNYRDCATKGRFVVGTPPRFTGTDHPSNVLTEAQARELIRLRGEGWSLRDLAKKFGVSFSTAGRVGIRTWKHIADARKAGWLT